MAIVLVARYTAKSGTGDQIIAALNQMAPQVKRDEPGCLVYQANRSNENPDSFLLYEVYADEAALLAHRETPHFKELIEGVVVPLLEQREREFYTPVVE